MDNKINWIKDWVEELEKRGKISFSFEDVLEAFPNHNGQVLKNSLTRLTRKGKILSVWKGFLYYHSSTVLFNGYITCKYVYRPIDEASQ